MSSNGTNYTNGTYIGRRIYVKPNIFYFYYTSETVLAVVGTLLNLWFLVAILTSRDMRSRFRNKIICNTLVVHLIDSAVIIPPRMIRSLGGWFSGCVFYSVLSNLRLFQDFIVNWLVVMLLVVFIAQIKDFNPRTRLTPKAITMGTVGLLILPWVASLIVVPTIVHENYYSKPRARAGCFYPTYDVYKVFKSIDTTAPLILATLLAMVATSLRSRRFTPRYSSGSTKAELICSGPEIDNTSAYITAVAVSIICDLIQLVMSFDYYIFKYPDIVWLNVSVISIVMSDARVVLMALPWLLLPDVRQRVRTWRPWNRSAPGIDLTVAYKRDDI